MIFRAIMLPQSFIQRLTKYEIHNSNNPEVFKLNG